MEIARLHLHDPADWPHLRRECLEFFSRCGGRRLKAGPIGHLASLSYEALHQPGTSIVAATVRGELGSMPVGISYAADYGKEACMTAVHPLYRNRRIGSSLLRLQISELGQLHCTVATGHTAALKMCFLAGMHAEGLEMDAAGRPVLNLKGVDIRPAAVKGASPDSNQEGELLCLSLF
ncbi:MULTISPECIES: N-acetyltransferase [Paenibacillus]|uniref:N-acetyltransferase n=1 Tax=Paenibacillus campinasensis TaxID=66347 RepID=A0A268F1G9_9BACL|nr:N-acetyltransferase [Paenibacillus campinasensis]MUG68932.1 N-acetyltransferase [Paenibacillus campinasensis]PAD79183.1 N-acetyltransferase [Paenibacillus campinasensis]